jgi:hypothetical protein
VCSSGTISYRNWDALFSTLSNNQAG